jgi:pyrimidine-nucleoside phosphorylase
LTLGSHLLVLAGKAQSLDEARLQLQASLDNGQAWAKFREFVAQQGGDLNVIDHPETLPIAPIQISLLAESSGFVQRIDAETCGIVATELGAGRARKEDAIDPAVGLVLQRKVGEPVQVGEALLTVHAADQQRAEQALAELKSAITISATPVEALPLVFESVA